MTASTESSNANANGGKADVKILMLHGYTQSGPQFRAKTRALEKLLAKALSPVSLRPVLIYPTGPCRLLPQDMPSYEPPSDPAAEADAYQPDAWAWWRKDDASGEYVHLDEGMEAVAQAIRQAGGIDGVCGFSQGGAAAGIVAAALGGAVPAGPAGDWVRELREANGGRAARFAVSYSGFWATPESLRFLYKPRIRTPSLHYLGGLDTVVDESRSRALVERCEGATTLVHPGGHHVPVSREWVMPLAAFIKQHVCDAAPKAEL
ncbi:dihydrofolate reductase [Metarhizium album ARSEF 1941]|uniref:Dihydrofolate reductase n=1 Tax=Metarhizium album (strain ARSEF 1941) TaxID=1081103 RepID=A0A0B2X3H8_METAS|nr:dihydrofolate reductase [Metarhizium album ARSEF 1941]KHO00273.1 dihydrofolate reductase [Metarhizium album ARSEF 1941]